MASLTDLYNNIKIMLSKIYVTIQQDSNQAESGTVNGIVTTNNSNKIQVAKSISKNKISDFPSDLSEFSNNSSNKFLRENSSLSWNKLSPPTASQTTPGIMSVQDKKKLDGLSGNGSNVSFTPSLSKGTAIGTLTINNIPTTLYCNNDTNTTYQAGTGLTLDTSKNEFSLTNASKYIQKNNTFTGYIQSNGAISTPPNTTYEAGEGLSLDDNVFSLTNASNYIKTSTTSGLITNNGNIDTTSYLSQNDITDTLTSTSNQPITSGAVYNALNTPPTPTSWYIVTDMTTNANRNFAQQMYYNYLTGMVELHVITPYRKIGAGWNNVSRLIGKSEITSLTDSTETLSSNSDINPNSSATSNQPDVADFTPYTMIYGIAQGMSSGEDGNSGKKVNLPLPIALAPDGKMFLYNDKPDIITFSGTNQRYKFYLTYRCRKNRININ